MGLDELIHRIRPAAGDPVGGLILLHGRGVDENDLFPLADLFDPGQELVVAAIRAPLQLPGAPGNHWYVVETVGHPEPRTFHSSYAALGGWLESFSAAHWLPPEKVALAGFSQGTVMSFALGLGADRPRPVAIVALSGFIPTVDGWTPDLDGRGGLPVYLSHGVNDPVISVEFARHARDLLDGHVALTYREHPGAHTIDPRSFGEVADLIRGALAAA